MRYLSALFGPLARQLPNAEPGTAADRDLLARYAASHDEAAFAALVARYGAMVLGVCRRALADDQLAEDAFQATFVILARKAGSLHRSIGLGGWLHVVARRVAVRARRVGVRWARREPLPGPETGTDPVAREEPVRPDWDEVLSVLDKELERLPARYRDPLVACYVRGRTQDEAARDLGWSLSTLRRRLDRARELLRARMTSRGATLSAALFGTVLGSSATAVPSGRLIGGAVRVATGTPGEDIPRPVAELARVSVGTTHAAKWLAGVCVVLIVGGVALGIGFSGDRPPAPPDPPARNAAAVPAIPDPGPELPGAPLPPGAAVRIGVPRLRHGGVDGITFVAGGDQIVSTGGGVVRLWDAKAGCELNRLGSPREPAGDGGTEPANRFVRTAAVTGNGKAAAFVVREPERGGWSRHVYELDLDGWQAVRKSSLGPAPDGLAQLVLSPDGRVVAEVRAPIQAAPELNNGPDGRCEIWLRDLADKNPPRRLDGVFEGEGRSAFIRLAFTPDGKMLVTGDANQHVRVWDVATGARVRAFGNDRTGLQSLAVSPDGKRVATCGAKVTDSYRGMIQHDAVVRVWDVASGDVLHELAWEAWPAGYYSPPFLAFTPDRQSVVGARGNFDRPLEVSRWSVAGGARTAKWPAPPHVRTPTAVAISPDGKTLAVGVHSDIIKLFDIATGKELPVAPDTHDGRVTGIAFTTGGKGLVTAGTDATARAWDAATGRPTGKTALGTAGESNPYRVSPGGKSVVLEEWVGTGERRYVVWNAVTGREVCSFSGEPDGIFGDDGKTFVFVTGEKRGRIHVWDLDAGKERRALDCEIFTNVLAIRGERLLVEHYHDKLTLLDLASGKSRVVCDLDKQGIIRRVGGDAASLTPPRADRLAHAALSADGKYAALEVYRMVDTAAGGYGLYVCELGTGKVAWRADLNDPVHAVAFSPDGRRLAVGGHGVTLYEAATGKRANRFDGHNGVVWCLAFSSDGLWLASGAGDGTAVVWARPGEDGPDREGFPVPRDPQRGVGSGDRGNGVGRGPP